MSEASQHTILLVDDHPLMRRGMRQLLELQDDFAVIGEASNGTEALQCVPELHPDLILLDNNMPQLNGIETLKRLRHDGYRGIILIFTVSDAEEEVRDAMRHGADGYLLKDMEPDLLITQIRDALSGVIVVSPALTRVLAQALRAPTTTQEFELTDRERQVLKSIAGGNSNKMIAQKLGITEGTVKVHVKNLLHKLGLRSRVEAAVWALEHMKS
jgi:two-component system nitrate/nitrite response regulator NarL